MRLLVTWPAAAIMLSAAPACLHAQSAPAEPRGSITQALSVIRDELGITALPSPDDFTRGDRSITSGTQVSAPVGVFGGTLTIDAPLAHNVVVVNGDVVIAPNAAVDADVVAVRGKILMQGGRISGQSITLGGDLRPPGAPPPAPSAMTEMRRALGVSFTTLAIVIVLGIGVLIFAGNHLTGIAETLMAKPGRSFLTGLLGQLALLPTLAVLVIALVLTILGILLIPFAIVAYFLAVLGASALGFLSTSYVVGLALGGKRARELPEKQRALRALLLGVLLFGGVWVLAALLAATPIVSAAVRGFAGVMTWVAITAGLGATILSRAGRRRSVVHVVLDESEPELSWQTPTPVTGVAAAKRPVAGARGRR